MLKPVTGDLASAGVDAGWSDKAQAEAAKAVARPAAAGRAQAVSAAPELLPPSNAPELGGNLATASPVSNASSIESVIPTKEVADRSGKLLDQEKAVLRAWMNHGERGGRSLSGTDLINELGTALLLAPNHEPQSAAEKQQLVSGNWPFYKGSALDAINAIKRSAVALNGGKEPVAIAALPVLLTDLKTNATIQFPLFRIDDADGVTKGFVDDLGRRYTTLDQWRKENKLPPGQVTFPEGGRLTLGADGLPKVVTERSHAVIDSLFERVSDWAMKIGAVGGFVVGGAALIGIGGVAIPVAGAALALGFGGHAVIGLVDAERHGETLNPVKSSQARLNWLTAAASLMGLGASAATTAAVREIASVGKVVSTTANLAPQLNVGAQVLGTAQGADMGVQLGAHWKEMSTRDKMFAAAQVAFFGATTGHQAIRAGGVKNLYSLDAVRRQLGMPVAAAEEVKPPSLLAARTTTKSTLEARNFFGEDRTIAADVAKTDTLISPEAIQAIRGGGDQLVFGRAGRLNAARFVNRDLRNDGDFRLAYGESAFKGWLKADAHLNDIPKGQLADRLGLDLLKEINALSYVPGEDSVLAKLGHALRSAQGSPVKPGQLRDYNSRSLPFQLKPSEVANVRANGVEVATVHVGDVGEMALVYPDHRRIPVKLNELIESTRRGIRDPKSDIVEVASSFAQKYVSLHPFQDGNGRTARLMLDRILAERDVPPPIFRDTGADVALSAREFQSEVRAGISRMISATGMDPVAARMGPAGYMQQLAWPAPSIPVPAKNLLRVNGEPFSQGADGFIYNMAGRPHQLSANGVLTPLSQLEHFVIARRVRQSIDPGATLTEYTKASRMAFEAATKLPADQVRVKVLSELPAIAADNRFELLLPKTGNEKLVALYDLRKSVDIAGLFEDASKQGSKSFAISRHNQIDLEMWHVQKALERAGDSAGARTMMHHREQLFVLAKEKLTSLAKAAGTSENPMGFSKQYEQLEYEHSLLSFNSLREAIAVRGDDTIRVWRGDVIMSSTVGMHPDYSPLNPDAFQLAKLRGASNGTASIVGDLSDVAGSSLGTGYLCYTTDLALLNRPNGFAEKFNPLTVKLAALPKPIREALTSRLTAGDEASTKAFSIKSFRDVLGIAQGRQPPPKGTVDVAGVGPESFEQIVRTAVGGDQAAALVGRYHEAYAKANSSPVSRFMNMLTDAPVLIDVADLSGLQGLKLNALSHNLARARDAIQLEVTGDALSVRTARRAFVIEMDKTDALPGLGTLGGHSFENEQEITGLGKVAPWRIAATYKRSDLDVDIRARTASALGVTPDDVQ